MTQVHMTLKSSNVKTGPIPVSTSSRTTCPDTCTLKKNGCYADSGPLALHWDKVTSGDRGGDWQQFCDTVQALPLGQLWRHNQSGDLPHVGGKIDAKQLAQLVTANLGKRGFTYTHHKPTPHNARVLKAANLAGFTVNLSAESLNEADTMSALGVGPVVTILPEGLPHKLKTPGGRDVVTCPATYRDDTSCATCQLCQRQRDAIIGFPVHGTSKRKAERVFMMRSI
jgi:hypothetical protein